MKNCIGLFGTCGNSKWRNPFVAGYRTLDIEFFNPQVDDWKEENAIIEAEHLATDSVILFPITSETYGMGSLAEIGFCILNAIKLEDRRDFVIFIDQKLDEQLVIDNPLAAKESLRARAIIKQHLNKLNLFNVYCVNSLLELMEVSIKLYQIAQQRICLDVFQKPHEK